MNHLLNFILVASYFTPSSMKVWGIILLIIGFTLKYWIGRRRFNRTNSLGVQAFKTYEGMRLTKLFEGLVQLTGNVLMILGVLAFLIGLIESFGHHR